MKLTKFILKTWLIYCIHDCIYGPCPNEARLSYVNIYNQMNVWIGYGKRNSPVLPFNMTHEHSMNQFKIRALYLTLFLTIKGSRSHGISISYKLNQQMNFKGKKCIKNTTCKNNQNTSKVTIEENPYFRGKGRFDLIPKNIHV